jgi:amino acid transporter
MKADEQAGVTEAKSSPPFYDDKDGVHSSSDAEVGTGDGEVQVETTKRGLKARHAQMIALGGTIGKSSKSN